MASVQLVEYQDTWPREYQRVAGELRSAIRDTDAVIEHIGSTSVPGLCSKPVLDIALGVASLAAAEASILPLAALGFAYRPGYEQWIPDRRYFVRPSTSHPSVHLHAIVLGGALWHQHLYFRNRLLNDTRLRESYASLKQRLAVVHAADKAGYTEAKAAFIEEVLSYCPHRVTDAQHGGS